MYYEYSPHSEFYSKILPRGWKFTQILGVSKSSVDVTLVDNQNRTVASYERPGNHTKKNNVVFHYPISEKKKEIIEGWFQQYENFLFEYARIQAEKTVNEQQQKIKASTESIEKQIDSFIDQTSIRSTRNANFQVVPVENEECDCGNMEAGPAPQMSWVRRLFGV